MSTNKTIISKELEDQLRSMTFNPSKAAVAPLMSAEPISTEPMPTEPVPVPKKKSTKLPSLNKRVVTVEYLDKFEAATIAHTRYESVQEFSHLLSNVSIVLLSISIITYLIFFLINPDSISLIALLILSLEAFTLLGVTLFTISKTTHFKQLSELAASDLSTCSNIIGNPRGEIYVSPSEPEQDTPLGFSTID